MTDLVTRIENARFLGREFLAWLWFECERNEGDLMRAGINDNDIAGTRIWLQSQLVLEMRGEEQERSALTGVAPSSGTEALEALRQGKTPKKARVAIAKGELEWSFMFDADAFSLSSVRIPAELKDGADEKFYERMFLVEQLERMMRTLFAAFLDVRTTNTWEREVVPAMGRWMCEMDGRAERSRSTPGMIAAAHAIQA